MNEELKRAIKKMANPIGAGSMLSRGIVLAVDKQALTCQVRQIQDDLILEDVKLKPVVAEEGQQAMGLILFPKVGSFVIVGEVGADNTDVCLLGLTAMESAVLDTGETLQFEVDAGGNLILNFKMIKLNDGQQGGIPLLKPLTETIRQLQKKINDLSDTFDRHVHGTSPTPSIPAPSRIAPLIRTTDLENKAISQ